MTSGGSGGRWTVFGAVVGTIAALVGILQFALGVVDLGGDEPARADAAAGTPSPPAVVSSPAPPRQGTTGDSAPDAAPGPGSRSASADASVSAKVDPCLVGRWKAAGFPQSQTTADGTVRPLTVTGYAYVNYEADGTGSFELDQTTDYVDGIKLVSHRDTGIVQFTYTARNGRITYADDTGGVTRTTRENGVVVSEKEADPIPDGGSYTCTAKTLTRQVEGGLNRWERQ